MLILGGVAIAKGCDSVLFDDFTFFGVLVLSAAHSLLIPCEKSPEMLPVQVFEISSTVYNSDFSSGNQFDNDVGERLTDELSNHVQDHVLRVGPRWQLMNLLLDDPLFQRIDIEKDEELIWAHSHMPWRSSQSHFLGGLSFSEERRKICRSVWLVSFGFVL